MKKYIYVLTTLWLLFSSCLDEEKNTEAIDYYLNNREKSAVVYVYKGVPEKCYVNFYKDDFEDASVVRQWRARVQTPRALSIDVTNGYLLLSENGSPNTESWAINFANNNFALTDSFEFKIHFRYDYFEKHSSLGLFVYETNPIYYNMRFMENAKIFLTAGVGENKKVSEEKLIDEPSKKEWNELMIRRVNENIAVFYNQKLMCSFQKDLSVFTSHFGIKIHKAKIRINDIEFKRIELD